MTFLPDLRRYFMPACLTLALFVSLSFVAEAKRDAGRAQSPGPLVQEMQPEFAYLPWGHVLTVVVDADAAYIGDRRVPFDDLEAYLRAFDGHPTTIDYAFLCGTDSARFGQAARAFVALTRVIGTEHVTIETRSLPDGTRRPAYSYWRDPWQPECYDEN